MSLFHCHVCNWHGPYRKTLRVILEEYGCKITYPCCPCCGNLVDKDDW